jgi:3,4-dihydroxy-2-butanone 4-phosphate synthase
MCLAGLKPYGVLCELMNPDGTMAKGQSTSRFAAHIHSDRLISTHPP